MDTPQRDLIKLTGMSQSFASLLLSGKRNAGLKNAKDIGFKTQTPWEVWTLLGTEVERNSALEASPLVNR